jgi:tRNA uridine 5-carboxymethylaminomethyl modification enzyme
VSGNQADIVVIGGGHAGVEAAWAAAAALGDGGRVVLVTMDPARIGQMSCNPAIGGLGKGQMVREIDALGGLMGRAIDASGIMFKLLNTSKGPAVQGPRAQADKYAYLAEVQRLLASRPGIRVVAGTVDEILLEGGLVAGVRLPAGGGPVDPRPEAIDANLAGDRRAEPVFPAEPAPADRFAEPVELRAGAVVLTGGTFMRGLMHTGERRTAGGRVGEGAAVGISEQLRRLGFELGRLKTGTPPRLARGSIDWTSLDLQEADAEPVAFSDLSPAILPAGRFPHLPAVDCRITATNESIHALIRENLHRAPMYCGQVEAETGPRYCPSIEDKVVRFADRASHHVFLEPESLFTDEVYCNGISTSLPAEVQDRIVRSMPGCERAVIQRYGYAVEYDMVWPHQIDATTMSKPVPGLFLAGQINCTTGYEEAAAQGLVAGLNAARRVHGQEPVRLGREESYIGVMMDDLVTKPPREPYRMFTSRAEHRLRLRSDNAGERLTPRAIAWGLACPDREAAFAASTARRARVREAMAAVRVGDRSLAHWLRRPEVTLEDVIARLPDAVAAEVPRPDIAACMVDERYAVFVERQDAEVRRARELDARTIPPWLEPERVTGLRSEAAEVLRRHRPATLGQASRLPGVNPADVSLLRVVIERGPDRRAAVGG